MNKNEIITAFELSAAAYRDVQPYYPCDYTTMLNNPKLHVECFLRRQVETLRITFRGTDSHENWKNDFKFWEKSIPYCDCGNKMKVHRGFLNSYKSVGIRDKILEAIDDDVKYIKICGHSLGAALSLLCAFDMQYNFPDRDIEAIVFGCPRVGNRAFAKKYNRIVTKTIRIENGNDVVTKVPFPLLNPFLNFRYVGSKMQIGKPRIPLIYSPNDHYPHEYYTSLLDRLL